MKADVKSLSSDKIPQERERLFVIEAHDRQVDYVFGFHARLHPFRLGFRFAHMNKPTTIRRWESC